MVSEIITSTADITVGINRMRLHKQRRQNMRQLETAMQQRTLSEAGLEALVWESLVLFQGYPFYTAKHLHFTYRVKNNEIFVDRKEKSITRSSVNIALQKVAALEGVVTGPKKLGVFGASYLWPVFSAVGLINTQQRDKL